MAVKLLVIDQPKILEVAVKPGAYFSATKWSLYNTTTTPTLDETYTIVNSFDSLSFAIPGSLCSYFGAINGFNFVFGIGVGITLYGLAYFLVHDVLIHRRFKWMDWFRNSYTENIIRAHKLHHKNIGKESHND